VHSKKKHIIFIEDSEADASVIHEALTTSSLECEVKRFRNGAEAIPTLIDESTPVPDVILLDLNMPKSDGLDILRRIRNTPGLTYTPVGILTRIQRFEQQAARVLNRRNTLRSQTHVV
jgi:chemotaxis family two-component system response regulator Rcp1